MSTNRLEAFTDGIFAIAITVLVLNIPLPKQNDINSLFELEHSILTYCFCFFLIAVYWNNHHNMLKKAKNVDIKVLWSNNFLLFFTTLLPFSALWVSNFFQDLIPQLTFGVVLLFMDLSFLLLSINIKNSNSMTSKDNLHIKRTLITISVSILAILLGILINPSLIFITNILIILIWIAPKNRFNK